MLYQDPSNMINTVIVDDEQRAREILKEILLLIEPEINILGEFDSVKTGIEGIKKLEPNLVFLDVDLSDGKGFDILAQFDEINFDVIFATGHNKYAIQAIKSSAFDFIVKPINIEELKLSLGRYKQKLSTDKEASSKLTQIELLIQSFEQKNKGVKRISIPSGNGVIFINTQDMIRCQAGGNCTYIYLKDGKKLTANKSLKEYESSLDPSQFLRVHQSHLVNKYEIEKYVKTEGFYVVMSDGAVVDISRRRKNFIEQELLQI